MSKINAIDVKDVHILTSGQVIIDISTTVKELVDNSIDANASQIDIIFKKYGIDSVECSDDGNGIQPDDYKSLTMKHYTSKIANFQDITNVTTLGFRGEALSSLCAISQVVVTTTVNPPRADKIEYDISGNIYSQTVTSRNKGTSVQISDLFYNLPVRRKELMKTGKRQFTKCITLLQSYAIINTNIKFSVVNITPSGKRQRVFSTLSNKGMQKNILSVFGSTNLHGLAEVKFTLDLNPYKSHFSKRYDEDDTFDDLNYTITVEGLLSKSSFGSGRNNKDRQFVYINKRPIEYPTLVKSCNETYRQFNNVQYPAFFLNFIVSPELIDLNVTPDKRTVILHNERYVIDLFKEELLKYFQNQDLQLPKKEMTVLKEVSLKNDSIDILPNAALKVTDEEKKSNSSFIDTDMDDTATKNYSSEIDIPFDVNTQIQSSSLVDTDLKPKLNKVESHVKVIEGESMLDGSVHNVREYEDKINSADDIDNSTFNENHSPNSNVNKQLDLHSFKNPLAEEFENVSQNKHNDIDQEDVEQVIINIDGEVEEHFVKIIEDKKLLFVGDHDSYSETPYEDTDKYNTNNVEVDNCDISNADSHDDLEVGLLSQETNVRVPIRDFHRDVTTEKLRSISDFNGINSTKKDNGLIYSTNLFINKPNRVFDEGAQFLKYIEKMKLVHHSLSIKQSDHLNDLEEGDRYLTLTVKKKQFNNMNLVGQFNLGFIITTCNIDGKSNLFIVDQHASDEKYNFETLQKNTVFKSQKLISSLPVELSVVDELVVMENIEIFEKNGFKLEVDDDGNQGCKIRLTSLPVSKRTLFNIEDFNELVQLVKVNDGMNKESIKCSKIRSMFAMRACRSSIMIGKPLNRKVMSRVVKNLSTLDKPWNCPHGRPTMRHLMELKNWDSYMDDYTI
ncbi:hypothetical protein TPHA_0F01490 [Tetrapisispora phaffii CBS 4417]|uniref:DNA mismatch repair protein PMS1 n=1 Tax=Tetrapisispora phaffii (strain ATCC 24235 / CBS 4417 / NBRC 1672 / NRRL Y-8282 / UCD 70-5) TaxID=1071381 RepID=G8BV51_TETPH|nr:hypothetical protein TPHA_0F01490 [Tetrapisispora phaffii CBS 4417]CCE63633.1 hypothetical protein TPHA_0F01490 [Tetrapisispora phaffii CBS 4417]